MKKSLFTSAISALALMASTPSFADLAGTATLTNNYIWRGLTQSINESAIQGGLKYTAESGAYVGTWTSNVAYDTGDAYSYEHDMYFGYSGAAEGFTYDLGYLYYNYDKNAGFDFGEVYSTLGFGNLSVSAYFVTNAEPDEAPNQDFSAFQTMYFSGNYSIPLESGATIGLHMGYHEGDFANAFNGVTEGYLDYNVSIAKHGFMLMVTDTDLNGDDDGDGFEDYANMPARDNDEMKFVVSYGLNFEL